MNWFGAIILADYLGAFIRWVFGSILSQLKHQETKSYAWYLGNEGKDLDEVNYSTIYKNRAWAFVFVWALLITLFV